MATKTIYLVRHGETADNRSNIHQTITVPLNERGHAQAAAAAKALADKPVDTLLVSDAVRAQETAAPIAEATRTTIETDDTLRELHRGVLIEGKHHFGWASITGSLGLFFHAANTNWHNGDGENLMEFRTRIESILEKLAKEQGEQIVVVSHRGIINGMRFGIEKGFHGLIYRFIMAALLGGTKNGSITTLSYDSERAKPWQIEHANDTRHLQSGAHA